MFSAATIVKRDNVNDNRAGALNLPFLKTRVRRLRVHAAAMCRWPFFGPKDSGTISCRATQSRQHRIECMRLQPSTIDHIVQQSLCVRNLGMTPSCAIRRSESSLPGHHPIHPEIFAKKGFGRKMRMRDRQV